MAVGFFDKTDEQQAIIEMVQTGVPVARRQVRLDGRPSHLGVSVTPLAGADGELQAAVCLFSDLTDVVELEEQLRLKEALAGVGELTAGLAHEFRNGLATIHGYARLLDPERLPAGYRPYVEGIRQETNAMGEVVTNFLNFARPEPLTLVPLNLGAIVERAAAGLPIERGAVELSGEFGWVLGDDVLLRQALSNLLRNSIEACASAGLAPSVHVLGALEPPYVRLMVEGYTGSMEDAAFMTGARFTLGRFSIDAGVVTPLYESGAGGVFPVGSIAWSF